MCWTLDELTMSTEYPVVDDDPQGSEGNIWAPYVLHTPQVWPETIVLPGWMTIPVASGGMGLDG